MTRRTSALVSKLLALSCLLFPLGCGGIQHLYEGPERPMSQVAIIEEPAFREECTFHENLCAHGSALEVKMTIDGTSPSTSQILDERDIPMPSRSAPRKGVAVLPGRHAIKLVMMGSIAESRPSGSIRRIDKHPTCEIEADLKAGGLYHVRYSFTSFDHWPVPGPPFPPVGTTLLHDVAPDLTEVWRAVTGFSGDLIDSRSLETVDYCKW